MSKEGAYEVGQEVSWNWGSGTAPGKIVELHEEPIEKTIKGSDIKRNGSPENRAVVIEQDNGTNIVKLESELN